MLMAFALSAEHLLVHASQRWRTLTIEETARAEHAAEFYDFDRKVCKEARRQGHSHPVAVQSARKANGKPFGYVTK